MSNVMLLALAVAIHTALSMLSFLQTRSAFMLIKHTHLVSKTTNISAQCSHESEGPASSRSLGRPRMEWWNRFVFDSRSSILGCFTSFVTITGWKDGGANPTDPYRSVHEFYNIHKDTIAPRSWNIADSSAENHQIESSINGLQQSSQLLIKGLTALGQLHPFVGGKLRGNFWTES